MLVAAIGLLKPPKQYCVVQKLECMRANDEPIVNSFDCPLLTLTDQFYAILPKCIVSPISIVHQCTDTCIYVQKSAPCNIERESIPQNFTVFDHDCTNNLYCLNIFCTNQ